MATTFHDFSKLPPELRHNVWECYLEDDKSGRHVVAKQGPATNMVMSISPTKPLASPLLRVNREARLTFLDSFNVSFDVYKKQPRCIFTAKSVQGHTLKTVDRSGMSSGLKLARRHVGVVHLRPEMDVFVFRLEVRNGSADRSSEYRMLHEYTTKRLSVEKMQQYVHHILGLGSFWPSPRRRNNAIHPGFPRPRYSGPHPQTYRYIDMHYNCHCRQDHCRWEDWEDVRWSAAETPREFNRAMVQAKVCVRTLWVNA
ncbi:hypothetical protein PG996_012256 [Apiospora saccharicola]|uniref:2EXR domain-containing protein n=1 Tax=Apiospora saccharicola TaxID=335842 RepID=A0ABR1U4E8_9PEZI